MEWFKMFQNVISNVNPVILLFIIVAIIIGAFVIYHISTAYKKWKVLIWILSAIIAISASFLIIGNPYIQTPTDSDTQATSQSSSSQTSSQTVNLFNERQLIEYKFNPSSKTFMPDQYWDGSFVRYLDLEYSFAGGHDFISGLSKIKYAYVFGVHAKSAEPPEIDIHTLPITYSPFNIAASFEVPINHERVDDHYHYDHYFIVLEDYSGNQMIDYLNVLWASGDDRKNKYELCIIYSEDWNENAYIHQNDVAESFMSKYNLYNGEPRAYLCKVSQDSLENLRNNIAEIYNEMESKISCEDVGKGAVVVPVG